MKEELTSTHEKIKASARALFIEKGFDGTKTRDIAKHAGINLALLNYHFKSKKNLYSLIMKETLTRFIVGLSNVLNAPETSLDQKIEAIVNSYIDFLKKEPQLPGFILGQLKSSEFNLSDAISAPQIITSSYFYSQLHSVLQSHPNKRLTPLHLLINVVSLTVFPIIAQPLLMKIGDQTIEEYYEFLEERKVLIPLWVKNMIAKN